MAAWHTIRLISASTVALGLSLSVGVGQERRQRQQARKQSDPPAPDVIATASVGRVEAYARAPSTTAEPSDQAALPRRPLVLVPVNGGGEVLLVPQRDDGGFSQTDLQRAAVAFSQQSPGKVHALAPRLLDLVYRTARHFDAQVVHVVSGYRRDRAGSRHTQGRAVDMAIDGVANDKLAAYVRDYGFVGVGYYPQSGFVHLDVRDASYFWIDDSKPNTPNHLIPVHEDQARKADADARARGETPDLYVPNNRAEDAAAAKTYARRAKQRRAAAAAAAATAKRERRADAKH